MSNGVTFIGPGEDRFKKVLRARINKYFDDNHLSKHWNISMLFKTLLLAAMYGGSYALMLCGHLSVLGMLAASVVTGFAMAGIGLNIAHDACHDAYTKSNWGNRLLSHSFTAMGVHAYNWRITHNIIHHTYTNVPYADGDLHPVPLLRYFDIQLEKRWYHKYQHIYAYPLYCLATIVWVFYKDYLHISRDTHVGYKKKPVPMVEWVWLFVAKFFHYTLFLILPYFVAHLSVMQIITNFVIMHIVAGITLATIFSVGHLVEEAELPRFDKDGVVHDFWTAHQLRTTANFSNNNRLLTWMIGGLNFQIEHHLFPRICHVHYPALAPIVQQTAAEFGLPYHAFPTFRTALRSHVNYLRKFGEQDLCETLGEADKVPLTEMQSDVLC